MIVAPKFVECVYINTSLAPLTLLTSPYKYKCNNYVVMCAKYMQIYMSGYNQQGPMHGSMCMFMLYKLTMIILIKGLLRSCKYRVSIHAYRHYIPHLFAEYKFIIFHFKQHSLVNLDLKF